MYPSSFKIKQEAVRETVDILDPSPPVSLHAVSRHRSPSLVPVEQDYSMSEFGDLEYPSSEVDPEDFKAEETEMACVMTPTTLPQFLACIEDKESMFDRILELMDHGKDKMELVT